MGMEENWQSYVEMTRNKANAHEKVAQYWDKVYNTMSLIQIFLSAATTICTLLPITKYISAGLGGLTTLVASVNGFLNPSLKRQQQLDASGEFRALMLKMVRVETEREYEELWKEYNKELVREPFLPAKY